MRRLVLAIVLALIGVIPATAAEESPYGTGLTFVAYRNGEAIGHHTLAFQRRGPALQISTSIDLAVKFLGLTVYRYTHQAQEVWRGETFQSLSSQTDDNGKKFAVRTPGSETTGKTGPPDILPSTHWNHRQVHQTSLLNTQTGAEARVQIVSIGRETVRTSSGSIEAMRYRYTGDIVMDQWFDDRGRWVRMSFAASDGSTIEYILQE